MPWGVWERDTGELVGDCGLFRNDGEWELAYGFRHDRWGSGYATEAGAACIRYGFEELGLTNIVADVPSDHAASIRVLEKLGFRLEREHAGKRYYRLTR
jgi:ribosomal-protein-alanine N-acetyltransferase